ncbi:MAG: hypothetical protein ACFBZ8_11945, partial [Opitutales bacterium]
MTQQAIRHPLNDLEEDKRREIIDAPRADRLGLLSEALGEDDDALLERISQHARLSVVDKLDLLPEPTRTIPLRLIHEYQCLPIQPPVEGQSQANGNGTATGRHGREPLHLVTVWPPEPVMDRWIRAACGRQPLWHLGPPSMVSETITQVFGVGSGSL